MRRLRLEAVFVVALSFLCAAAADARVFQMSGQWRPQAGFSGVPLPWSAGFVPGMGLVTATGSAPARLTLRPDRFMEDGPGTLFPLPGMTLVQLTTMIDARGPQSTVMFGPGPKPWPASFTWRLEPPGSLPGQVRYRAGPNRFGGTARMLLAGGGSVSVTAGMTGMGGALILHNPFLLGSVVGAGYAVMGSVMVPRGDITLQGAIPPGVVTMPGPVVLMGAGAASQLVSTGFPWTTGMIRVVAPCYCSLGSDPTIFTLTGLDDRTPLGAGRIVMVSGGLVRRTVAQAGFAQANVLDMTIEPLAVPSLSRAGVAAALLALLTAGYALRRRF
jgi:hypothetical protein